MSSMSGEAAQLRGPWLRRHQPAVWSAVAVVALGVAAILAVRLGAPDVPPADPAAAPPPATLAGADVAPKAAEDTAGQRARDFHERAARVDVLMDKLNRALGTTYVPVLAGAAGGAEVEASGLLVVDASLVERLDEGALVALLANKMVGFEAEPAMPTPTPAQFGGRGASLPGAARLSVDARRAVIAAEERTGQLVAQLGYPATSLEEYVKTTRQFTPLAGPNSPSDFERLEALRRGHDVGLRAAKRQSPDEDS